MRYKCSKHGEIGNPDCQECWNILKEHCSDNDALLLDEEGEVLN